MEYDIVEIEKAVSVPGVRFIVVDKPHNYGRFVSEAKAIGLKVVPYPIKGVVQVFNPDIFTPDMRNR
jgi:hypothetical protein